MTTNMIGATSQPTFNEQAADIDRAMEESQSERWTENASQQGGDASVCVNLTVKANENCHEYEEDDQYSEKI